MIIKLQTRIGKNALQIQFDKMSELHKFNMVYGNLPKKCDACGGSNLFLSFKNPKGNDYYTLQCGDCDADANFGIHKDGKGLFWKREKMEVYQANGENKTKKENTKQPMPESVVEAFPDADVIDDNDVSF